MSVSLTRARCPHYGSQTSATLAKYARTALRPYIKIMIAICRSKSCNFSEIAANLHKTLQQEDISPWLNEANETFLNIF
ncbi:MAG: hypothetical protein HC840_16710 [Leptolyngbyaceae cyanobacterium RM2_2_4]|nr:hypothetical protein [Leptolyngbyaceae cyanobacterium SM1_4_3]NJN89303.1 hypothetical protein [Leptolyngbyaceae cyanobacterium SL_5_14]NJO50811.1 hypothetical protein [Leptolyngbyaceae cyanobacterium RM2_2_4]NJO66675.1 hypothetical protein [Leptolyngbyaceae cyanobacterium RM1_405_57]